MRTETALGCDLVGARVHMKKGGSGGATRATPTRANGS